MGLFDVDYNKLSWQNIPVRLRQSIHFAWLKCLVSPVVYLHGLFTANRANNLYVLSHNSQVCYIEALLNDTFDNTARGIFLSEIEYHDPVYIYKALENKPVYIDLTSEIGTTVILPPDPVPLYTDAEVSFTAPCFIVNVPLTVSFDITRMRAIIDQYRLAGRNIYQIITY